MMALAFIAGFILCGLLAWYQQREKQKEYDRLYRDFLKLVNEVSVRSGGRSIFKPDKLTIEGEKANEPTRGDYNILTPSMAEVQAMNEDEQPAELTDVDIEYLKQSGVIQ